MKHSPKIPGVYIHFQTEYYWNKTSNQAQFVFCLLQGPADETVFEERDPHEAESKCITGTICVDFDVTWRFMLRRLFMSYRARENPSKVISIYWKMCSKCFELFLHLLKKYVFPKRSIFFNLLAVPLCKLNFKWKLRVIQKQSVILSKRNVL